MKLINNKTTVHYKLTDNNTVHFNLYERCCLYYIYKTVDNGENWNAIIQPGPEEIISLQITDGGTVILLTNSG